mmetsp:Transcript_12584/g.28134  ORF Transcript_12584/g.28134 Transcript_12584/m.28134 type:complete len:222 (-) Transcript_12584:1816-2481(-)
MHQREGVEEKGTQLLVKGEDELSHPGRGSALVLNCGQDPPRFFVLLLDHEIGRLLIPGHLLCTYIGLAQLIAAMPHVLSEVYESRTLRKVQGLDVDNSPVGLAQRIEGCPLAMLDLVADLQHCAQGRRELEIDAQSQVAPVRKEAHRHRVCQAVPHRRIERELKRLDGVGPRHRRHQQPKQGHVQRHAVGCCHAAHRGDRTRSKTEVVAIAASVKPPEAAS